MTRSGERSALEPDPVPVIQRIRDLIGRFPEGPLPQAEVKDLRESIQKPRPGNRALLQDRLPRTRENFKDRQRDREAAQAELADMVRSAASCSDTDLARLTEQIRGLRDDQRLRLDPESIDLGLRDDQARTIALHLLHTGVIGTEVLVGLQLLERAGEPDDTDLIGTFALLGRSYGSIALKVLKRLGLATPGLFALAGRVPLKERHPFAVTLGAAPIADIDDLVATLSVCDAITLLRMTEDFQGTPKWIRGNQRLAAAVVAAAENPLLMGDGPQTPVSMVWLRDGIRYGPCALLGYSPGQRLQAIERLGTWLSTPRALQAVEAVVARRPRDSQAIWLHHQVIEAQRDRSGDFPEGLAIRIAVPPPGSPGDVRTHLLIDGVPLVPRSFGIGMPRIPERLLGVGDGLQAAEESREIVLAEAECTEGCCGALRARIRRDEARGRVEWEVWRTRGAQGDPERFSFDAAAYDAEVARAADDFTWAWPARRAARLLRERMEAEPELMSRWECRFGSADSWNRERSVLTLHFAHPEVPSASTDRPWLQFEYQVEVPDAAIVDDDVVAAVVDRIVKQFRETDPKRFARVIGGSRELAESLGIPW